MSPEEIRSKRKELDDKRHKLEEELRVLQKEYVSLRNKCKHSTPAGPMATSCPDCGKDWFWGDM